ncbi:MAG TPA: FixH family protein, partial [Bordetella sp.]|nr:FixH family protein [Bordetella sp.]
MTTSDPPNAWHREPWPWFLMAGPLLAILGCIITIYLAVTRFADQPI